MASAAEFGEAVGESQTAFSAAEEFFADFGFGSDFAAEVFEESEFAAAGFGAVAALVVADFSAEFASAVEFAYADFVVVAVFEEFAVAMILMAVFVVVVEMESNSVDFVAVKTMTLTKTFVEAAAEFVADLE